MNSLNWLAQQENLIAVRPRQPEDRRLTLTADQQNRIMILTLFIIPGLVFASGVYTWWRRSAKHARPDVHAHPRRRARGARRLHLLRRFEAAGGRRRRRAGDEGEGLHRRGRQDQRAAHHLPGRDVAAQEDRARLEDDRAGADRGRSARGDRRRAGAHQPRDRPRRRRERRRTSSSSAWPNPPITVEFKAEGGASGTLEAGQQERDAGRDLRAEERREARVPGVVVPGNAASTASRSTCATRRS